MTKYKLLKPLKDHFWKVGEVVRIKPGELISLTSEEAKDFRFGDYFEVVPEDTGGRTRMDIVFMKYDKGLQGHDIVTNLEFTEEEAEATAQALKSVLEYVQTSNDSNMLRDWERVGGIADVARRAVQKGRDETGD